MPRLRILADNAAAASTGASGADPYGNPIYDVAANDAVEVRLDATGYVGTSSISASVWEVPDGGVTSAATISGPVVSCAVAVPDGEISSSYRVRNTMTLASGLKRVTTVWLRTTGR